MFRFQLCRSALWDIADSYRNEPSLQGGRSGRLMAQLISIRTAMQIAHGDSQFLLHFHDHEESRAALNRAYPLAELEAGSYDAILDTVLDPENLDARDAAWHYFLAETEPTGEIGRAMEDDAAMRAMVDAVRQHHTFGEAAIRRLLEKRGVVFPAFENRLRKSLAAGALKAAGEAGLGGMKALGHFSGRMARTLTHSPLASPTEFTRDQIDLMKTLIQPGDIILTYTSGNLSNLFLPGVFKHGIVYVGNDLQRDTLEIRHNWKDVPRRQTLIEAVGKGVVWNDLDAIVGDKITRMAVLRPRLSSEERLAYLQGVYDYLGRPYDLRFDFTCSKRLCCTELIYHTLDGRGGIQFPMVTRFGMPTLAGDDILNYYLSTPDGPLSMVFLGVPEPGSHAGTVLSGADADSRLRMLLSR